MTPAEARGRRLDPDEPVAALELDRYLDALLAARDEALERRRGAGAGGSAGSAPPDEATPTRIAADRLAEVLVRVHPSFRFEERLARRLAELAATLGPAQPPTAERPIAASAPGPSRSVEPRPPLAEPVLPLTEPRPPAGAPVGEPAPAAEQPLGVAAIASATPIRVARTGRFPIAGAPLRNPIVIGGAITSAAISIAGVALVAWRRSRPRHPLAEAVGLAHGGVNRAVLADRPLRLARRPRARRPALLAALALRAAERAGAGDDVSIPSRP